MNSLENALHYPWGEEMPAAGSALQLAPGVVWLRMGLPFVLNHINLWLLRDDIDGRQGWAAVDTCVDNPQARAQWEQVIASEMQGLPLLRVIATHMHPDHLGLAHWLCDRFSAPLWISTGDFLTARLAVLQNDSFGGQAAADFFAHHGMDNGQVIGTVLDRKDHYAKLVPKLPEQYRRLQDGQLLSIGGRNWRCISGFGHSPEHMALFCEDPSLPQPVLISGDMVLPRISTNVSLFVTEPDGNPLQLFLDSLDKFLPLPQNTLVLPSHGKPFVGLHERIAQLRQHHQERLAEVLQACRGQARCAAEIVPVMFKRELDAHQTTFALGESMAHLNLLWHQGELRREVDARGVMHFEAA